MDGLTALYQSQLKRTRTAVGHAVSEQWKTLGSYNEQDVPRFVNRISPIVQAGQRHAVALSSAYAARKLGTRPVGVQLADLNLRNGVPMATVYRRPFVDVWSKLKTGDGLEDAISFGGVQAHSSSLMDVALATTAAYIAFTALYNATQPVDAGTEIVAWARVADPGCCDFCQMLDGVHTGPDQPQPLHNRCGCTADPIMRSVGAVGKEIAPGSTVDDVTIHEHGELGPVITQKGDSFTSLADITDSGDAPDGVAE